jgi:hypothetical protein
MACCGSPCPSACLQCFSLTRHEHEEGATSRAAILDRAAPPPRPSLRFRRPRIGALFTILAVVSAAAATVASQLQVPEYVFGAAVPAPLSGASRASSGQLLLVLPAAARPRLAVGQAVIVTHRSHREPVRTTIVELGPVVSTANAARAALRLRRRAPLPITGRTALALASAPSSASGAARNDSSIYQVQVEIKRESALSVLPLVGRLSGG